MSEVEAKYLSDCYDVSKNHGLVFTISAPNLRKSCLVSISKILLGSSVLSTHLGFLAVPFELKITLDSELLSRYSEDSFLNIFMYYDDI